MSRGKSIPPMMRRIMRAEYDSGDSYATIAARYDLARQTVRQAILRDLTKEAAQR